MAQTKRKRRTKHRGTPAGTIEARGRTGRKLEPSERAGANKRGGQRPDRRDVEPTWKQSIFRAAFASVLLFVTTQVGIVGDMSVAQGIFLSLFALAIYVPLGYYTDRALYNRRMRKKAEQRRAR
jgi:hypothetical protein